MLKIFFYLKTEKAKQNGDAPIYAKIMLDKQKMSMSTGKYISLERWTFTNKLRNVLKLEQEKVLKKSLEVFTLNLNRKYNEISEVDSNIDLLFHPKFYVKRMNNRQELIELMNWNN